MKFAALVDRISGEGADAWVTHYDAKAARERGEDVIVLSVGDPDLEAPGPVVERAVECLRSGDTHYTPASGRHALREAIAEAHAARTGQPTEPENVVYFAGAQNALFAASMCLAGAGDEVITFDPMYPTYPATIEVSGARLVRAPSGPGFRPDLAALESLLTARTRAIFWATPNNPSGVVLSESELAVIAELARRHELWLVSDEVYAGLAPGGRVPSLAARLPERVVTVSSLSKSHSMPGWRAGWLVGPRELATHAESLAMCMLFGLPGFIQEAAITALSIAPEAERRIRDFCNARRERFLAGLAAVPGIRATAPQAGMFMMVDVSATGLSGYDFMRALYERERVSVLDGGAFGRATARFIRVCFATDEATIDAACARIRRFCELEVSSARTRHGAS
ncbi:MAG: pyridoxal phosphate-dependent aminotransferase [Gammaproteobacteria bacterium]|nr:MAG: pyridoxal phosphate-dependent aminotransferase [Gammaproteobacteria bacterium]